MLLAAIMIKGIHRNAFVSDWSTVNTLMGLNDILLVNIQQPVLGTTTLALMSKKF